MTWFITEKTQINCAETGVWLSRHDDGWWSGRANECEMLWSDQAALALLAAIGHRWDGSAIVPLSAPVAGLTLEPVDLSKGVAMPGHYWVRLYTGECMWLFIGSARPWAEYSNITRAYHLPEKLP